MRPLKIAQIAPASERVPPKKYGGTERVVAALTEELVRRGHDVTLFASGDSETSAKLSSVYPRALREARIKNPYGLNEWTMLHLGNAYQRQQEFDIIHDHNSIFGLPLAQFAQTPTVITMHGAISPTTRRMLRAFDKPNLVAISKNQASHITGRKVASIIHHGLPMSKYPFKKDGKNYLLVVGRIAMNKGTHFAIDVAQDLNLPLIIAAKVDPDEEEYFNYYIAPRLWSDQIRWVGEVDETERNNLMKNALCLLHPVIWDEPFGLVMIEAMACGCPVIGFRRGSIPEIVAKRKAGYVVEDVDEMIDAVKKVNKIDRKECRQYALENFNAKIMTDRYEELYEKILGSTAKTIAALNDNKTSRKK